MKARGENEAGTCFCLSAQAEEEKGNVWWIPSPDISLFLFCIHPAPRSRAAGPLATSMSEMRTLRQSVAGEKEHLSGV